MFNLPGSNKKTIVGLAVTPNLGLEAAVYDDVTKEIVKYGSKYLEYNIASRSIEDTNLFRTAVADLFNELNLSFENSNIFIVLPNVHFGFRSFEDNNVGPEELEAIISAEATESYIFKQEEPVCAYMDVNAGDANAPKYIAYSALQRSVFDNLQDAIMDLGGMVVGIESAVTAIPRAIALTGVCDNVIVGEHNWSILLINPNNYAIFQMSGSRLLDYAEIPFAIMSFEGEEVYPAIASSAVQYLSNYKADKLVIVSQTDNVSAKVLKSALSYDKPTETFDSNSYSAIPCVNVGDNVLKQAAASLSLCVLGASVPKWENFTALNAMGINNYDGTSSYGTITVGGKQIEITSRLVFKVCVILSIIFAVLAALIIIPLFGLNQYNISRAQELQQKIDALNTENTGLEGKIKASVGALIKQIGDANKQAINYYDSLSTDIPSQVWLTYYINKNGKEVGIEGLSVDINQVYAYFSSLKLLAPQSDIKLNKLEVFNEDQKEKEDGADEIVLNNKDTQQTFSFEISNTSYEKTFDENGNKATKKEGEEDSGKSETKTKKTTSSSSGSVPKVPDVDANLKEAE